MERSLTIRFSHIDGANIVFYPRYLEILSELYADVSFMQAPFAIQTNFMKPNYLGDLVDVACEKDATSDGWVFTGRKNGQEHFSIKSLPVESALDRSAHRPDRPAFRADAMSLAPWTTDCTGNLQVSRYFELQNAAVEQWFPRTLATSFHEFHVVNGFGMPTVEMRTRCRELPRAGDTVTIWIRPTEIREKSITYTCWLVRDDACLLQNEQVIVFVRQDKGKLQTIPIPAEIRALLQEQYVAP